MTWFKRKTEEEKQRDKVMQMKLERDVLQSIPVSDYRDALLANHTKKWAKK